HPYLDAQSPVTGAQRDACGPPDIDLGAYLPASGCRRRQRRAAVPSPGKPAGLCACGEGPLPVAPERARAGVEPAGSRTSGHRAGLAAFTGALVGPDVGPTADPVQPVHQHGPLVDAVRAVEVGV